MRRYSVRAPWTRDGPLPQYLVFATVRRAAVDARLRVGVLAGLLPGRRMLCLVATAARDVPTRLCHVVACSHRHHAHLDLRMHYSLLEYGDGTWLGFCELSAD